jgi:hypothetical protein
MINQTGESSMGARSVDITAMREYRRSVSP